LLSDAIVLFCFRAQQRPKYSSLQLTANRIAAKTNFMIIKSPKKNYDQVNINIESADGTINVLQRKQKIKYLGVLMMKQCLLIIIFHTSVQELHATMVLYLS